VTLSALNSPGVNKRNATWKKGWRGYDRKRSVRLARKKRHWKHSVRARLD
jgi:hypothetical protein